MAADIPTWSETEPVSSGQGVPSFEETLPIQSTGSTKSAYGVSAEPSIPQLSQRNPTIGQRVSDLLHELRTSQPVEKILGKTPEEIASNPALESAPTTTDAGLMGIFENKKPIIEPKENPQTIMDGVHNLAASVVNSVASPGGFATMGLGSAPLAVQKVVGAAFGAQGAKMGYDSIKELATSPNLNAAQKVMAVGQLLLGGLMTTGGAHVLAKTKPVAAPIQNTEIPKFEDTSPASASAPDSMLQNHIDSLNKVTAAVSSDTKQPVSGVDARLSGAAYRMPSLGYAYDAANDVYHPVRKLESKPKEGYAVDQVAEPAGPQTELPRTAPQPTVPENPPQGGIEGRRTPDGRDSSQPPPEQPKEVVAAEPPKTLPNVAPPLIAPVKFLGYQKNVEGQPPFELWNITENAPGLNKGSTVLRQSVERLGYKLPETPQPPSQPPTPPPTVPVATSPPAEIATPQIIPEPVAGAEIPLGVNRPENQNPELRKLSDQQFQSEYKNATKQVDQLEKNYDEKFNAGQELTPQERQQLADAQDRWSSASLEKLRRDNMDTHTEDIFHQMIQLADLGNESAYSKFKVLAEILQQRGNAKPEDVTAIYRMLPDRLKSNPDFQEALSGKLGEFKKWLERYQSEQPAQPTSAPAPKQIEAPNVKQPWEMTLPEFTDWWKSGGGDKLPAFQAHNDPRTRALPESEFFNNERRSAIRWWMDQGKEIPPSVLSDYPELAKQVEGAKAETPVEQPATPKFRMTFRQFYDAPREGELLDELRKLPRIPKTDEEISLKAEEDKARSDLYDNNLGWIIGNEDRAYTLKGKSKKLWEKYQKASNAYGKWYRDTQEARQRKLYDQAVNAGVIENPESKPIKQTEQPVVENTSTPPLDRARLAKADKYLDSQILFNGKQTSVRNMIEQRIAAGGKLEEETVPDAAKKKQLEEVMRRYKNRPFGNENHPDTKKYNAAKSELAAGPKKTEYRLYDADGERFVRLKKTGADYAKSITKVEAAPVEKLTSGSKVKIGKSPQPFTVVKEMPKQPSDLPDERYFTVKNDKTGEEQIVESNSMAPIGSGRAKAEELAAKLESLKTGIGKGGQLHAFGLAADLWDRAVSAAQAIIRAGGSVADALNAAMDYIKQNYSGQFDEQGARQAIEQQINQGEPPKPSTTEAPPEAPTPNQKRAQVGGIPEIGQLRDTESIADNKAHIRENIFDGRQPITPEQNDKAWQVFGELTGENRAAAGGKLRSDFGNSRILLPLVKGELLHYAIRQAASGDDALLRALYDHSADFETVGNIGGGASVGGSTQRGERENFKNPVLDEIRSVYEEQRQEAAQRGSTIDRETFFNILKKLQTLKLKPEEVDSLVNEGVTPDGRTISDLLNEGRRSGWPERVRAKAEAESEKEVSDKANQVAERKLNELEQKNSGAEYMKAPEVKNKIRQVISEALKSRDPILENPMPVVEKIAKQLTDLGVNADTAQRIGFEIESIRRTEFANIRTRAMERAARATNIRSLIDDILSTPYRAQSDPQWVHDTSVRWFESNGLSRDQAEAATRIFSDSFKKALDRARNRIVESELRKAPPKTHDALERMIRSGIFDADKNWIDTFAEKSGWKKPSREQLEKLQELEQKLADPELSPEEYKAIQEQQMHILRHVGKKDGAAIRAMGEGFTASLLSGVRTFTVQQSPLLMTMRDIPVMIISDPKNIPNIARSIFNAYKNNAIAAFKFAWQKDAYGFHLAELEHGYNELKRISEQTDAVISDPKASLKSKGIAYAKKLWAFQRYVFRMLNSLDQTSMSVAREWKLAYYSSIAFKEAGLGQKDVAQLIDAVDMIRQNEFDKAISSGLDQTTAKVRANSRVEDAVWDFVNNKTGDSRLADKVLKASENDVYNTVGRMPEGIKAEDEGFLTRYTGFNWFLQKVSEFRGRGGLENIGATAIVGMINIPFRTTRFFSDFSPYGLLRYGIYKYRLNRGLDNFWKQSYGNELQAKARLRMAIAGTVTMALATAWMSTHSTADEEAGKEGFELYITGKGPSNRQLADAWNKRGWKQYSMNFVIGGKIMSIPLTRTGEALLMPFILPAALDDIAWKKKEAAASGRTIHLPMATNAAYMIGEFVGMTGQRGILQTFGQLEQALQSGSGLSRTAAKLTIGTASAVVIPFKQLLSSVSEALLGTMDQSSVSSMIANQFPIVGLPFQNPALNRFADKMYDRSWYGLASRTGVPLVFQMDNTAANNKLYTTLIDKGVSPSPLQRTTVEDRYGYMSNDQFNQYAQLSGSILKKAVQDNLQQIQKMDPVAAKKLMIKLSSEANNEAATKMGLVRVVDDSGKLASNEFAQQRPAASQTFQQSRRGSAYSFRVPKRFKIGSIGSTGMRQSRTIGAFSPRTKSLYGTRNRSLYGIR